MITTGMLGAVLLGLPENAIIKIGFGDGAKDIELVAHVRSTVGTLKEGEFVLAAKEDWPALSDGREIKRVYTERVPGDLP